MTQPTCGTGSRWCARADSILDLPGMHVLEVARDETTMTLLVESDTDVGGCPACGVVAVGHGRRQVELADAPCFGTPVRLRWRKRIWRCPEPSCPIGAFTEQQPHVAGPRAKLTARAIRWATDCLVMDDTTVAALARRLGVDWHTIWKAIEAEAQTRTSDPDRLEGVEVLGVDEHIWRPSRVGDRDRAVTSMVDLTRCPDGCLHARLLDVVVGRSGTAYADWLGAQDDSFTSGVKQAALDPFRGYANALRDQLPDTVAVLDAFHVVKLGTAVVDEVRRRVQQETTGHRGHKDDPLYKVRGLLRRGAEHLTDRQVTRLEDALDAGDPGWEVTIAWRCYQQLRSMYQATDPTKGRAIAEHLIATFPTCPIPEVARLGRTLRQWRTHVLTRFEVDRISNGGTEAINLIIEKTRRLAHGFRNFENYRLRILLAASGLRPYRRCTHA